MKGLESVLEQLRNGAAINTPPPIITSQIRQVSSTVRLGTTALFLRERYVLQIFKYDLVTVICISEQVCTSFVLLRLKRGNEM